MINGLEYDIQLLFSQFLGWLLLLFHTVIVAGISLRVVMKRRPIGVSLAWLALIYAIPFAGVGFYVLFGEIRLGRRRAERAKAMYPPTLSGSGSWPGSFPSTAARWAARPSHCTI